MINYQEVVLHCVVHHELQERRERNCHREKHSMQLQKKVKRENQNKSQFELCAESWSGKTEQIKVTGNKILLINSNREERDIKMWRLEIKGSSE